MLLLGGSVSCPLLGLPWPAAFGFKGTSRSADERQVENICSRWISLMGVRESVERGSRCRKSGKASETKPKELTCTRCLLRPDLLLLENQLCPRLVTMLGHKLFFLLELMKATERMM